MVLLILVKYLLLRCCALREVWTGVGGYLAQNFQMSNTHCREELPGREGLRGSG